MKVFIGFAALVLLFAVSLTFAQDAPTPPPGAQTGTQDATVTPEPVACALDDLKTYYTGLVDEAQAAFEAAPPAPADLDPGLMNVLYEAGKSLQARMLACGYIPADIQSLPVGSDTPLERVLEIIDTLTPDPLRGQALYLGEEFSAKNAILGCAGCHEGGAVGPATEGTWTRWDEQHSLLPQYADKPFEYYAAESVLHPNAFVPDPYLPNLMPAIFGEALGYQDLADIIAFLGSQDQLLDDAP